MASAFLDGFGLSQSSVSRTFQERSRRALETFEARSLADEDFVALWIDGKYLAGVQVVICLGTRDGWPKAAFRFCRDHDREQRGHQGSVAGFDWARPQLQRGALVRDRRREGPLQGRP